jgi:hypothetical protein
MHLTDPSLLASARTIGCVVRALALNAGRAGAAASYLAASGGPQRGVELLRAAVGATSSENLSQALKPAGRSIGDLIRSGASLYSALLRAGARRVLARVRYVEQGAGARAAFLAPGQPAPLSSGAYEAGGLTPIRLVALLVRSNEVLRADPEADAALGADLADAVALGVDVELLQHGTAPGIGTPGGIGNGAAVIAAGAGTVAGIDDGLRQVLQAVYNSGGTPSSTVLALNPSLLALMQNTRSSGQHAWPTLNQSRPTLAGCLVVPTAGQQWGGSPGAGAITAIDARQARFTDSDELLIDTSEGAAIEQSDAPSMDGNTGTGASVVSMFQTDATAIRATKFLAWRAHSASVATLTGVAL